MPRSRTVSSPSSLNASAPSLMHPSLPTHFFPLGLISRLPAICASRCTCASVSLRCPLNAFCSEGSFDPFAIFGMALVSCFSAEYRSLISSSSRSFKTSFSALFNHPSSLVARRESTLRINECPTKTPFGPYQLLFNFRFVRHLGEGVYDD